MPKRLHTSLDSYSDGVSRPLGLEEDWRAKPAPEGKQGRPRALDFGDTQVSGGYSRHTIVDSQSEQFLMQTVTRRNDMYLEELREVLEERCGVHVSESTIWRTLQRVGFRMKEVRSSCQV